MADSERAKVALGEWLAMTPAEREVQGLPPTQTGFAERWGITARTVIRWKQSDPVVAETFRLASERLSGGLHEPEAEASQGGPKKSQGAPPSGFLPAQQSDVPDLPPLDGTMAGDPLMAEFAEIRRALVQDAKRGGKGLDTYMRHIGRHVVEEERAARESGFRDLSDDELVVEMLSLIGRPSVEAWLEKTDG